MATYSEMLKDPRWQKVRLEKLQEAEWMCQRCMDKETMLSVHHKRYVKGRKPWEYKPYELVVLCQPCHEEEHSAKDMRSELMARLHVDGPASTTDFFAFAAGYIEVQTNDELISELVDEFEAESPYQTISGRFAGTLLWRFNLTASAMADAIRDMNDPDGPLSMALEKIFSDHGMKPKGFRG